MARRLWLSVTLFAVVAQSGCILNPVKPEKKNVPELFLQGFLVAGGPIDNIILRKTIPPEMYYDFMPLGRYAVSGAEVVITIDGAQHPLAELHRGTYGDPNLIARSGATCEIEVRFPANHEFTGRRLYGTTTIPEKPRASVTIHPYYVQRGAVLNGNSLTGLVFPRELSHPDSFGTTAEKEPFRLSWPLSASAAGYMVVSTAVDTQGTGLLRQRDYEDYLDGVFRDPVKRQGKRTAGFYVLPDSSQSTVYWLLFSYQGWHDVSVVACDTGYWDYMVTVLNDAGTGADSDAGVKLNVQGGLGIFCSYAADTTRVYIQPEWLPSTR